MPGFVDVVADVGGGEVAAVLGELAGKDLELLGDCIEAPHRLPDGWFVGHGYWVARRCMTPVDAGGEPPLLACAQTVAMPVPGAETPTW
jgi:hypothetical protein